MEERIEQIKKIIGWRVTPRGTSKVGDIAERFLKNQVSPKQAKFGAIVEIWSQLLPLELAEHTKIWDVSNGELKVKVDLSAYLYELKLMSGGLVKELQKHCPRARIKAIKFIIS